MTRELLGGHIREHLNVVEHHARNEVTEGLNTDTANGVCLLRVKGLACQDFVEVLHVALCGLRASASLLGVKQGQDCGVLFLYDVKTTSREEVASGA